MLKILELNLFCENDRVENYEFDDINYIYGKNNTGKSLLLHLINYMFGSSIIAGELDGTAGIKSLELILKNNETKLFLKREISNVNSFFYKRNIDDGYLKISEDVYKNEIIFLINNGFNDETNVYATIFNEQLTHRSFYSFSFCGENSLGDILNVFPKLNEEKNYYRKNDVLDFLFNYENLSEITKLTKEISELENDLKEFNNNVEKRARCIVDIKSFFLKINLKENTDDVYELKKIFDSYKLTFDRDNKTIAKTKKELIYLLKASHFLSEEYKVQSSLKDQTQSISTQNSKINKIIDLIVRIEEKNENYKVYTDELKQRLALNLSSNDILYVTDYEATLKKIEKKKNEIDDEIKLLNSSLERESYEESMKNIGLIEEKINEYFSIKLSKEDDNLSLSLDEKRKKLKLLKNNKEMKKINFINDKINQLFFGLKDKIDFIENMYKNENFLELQYDPYANKLGSYKKAYLANGTEIKSYYEPGSKAKKMMMQLCVYITFQAFLKNEFKDIPYLPFLFLDAIDSPLDQKEDRLSTFYDFLKTHCIANDIQLFITSTKNADFEDESKYIIDISNGLNPSLRK